MRLGGPSSLTLAVVTSTSPPERAGARPAGPARRTAGTSHPSLTGPGLQFKINTVVTHNIRRRRLNKLCPPEIAKLIFTCLRKSIFTDVSKVKDLKSVKGLYDGINVQITYKTECM